MPFGDGTGPRGDPNWACQIRTGQNAFRGLGRGKRLVGQRGRLSLGFCVDESRSIEERKAWLLERKKMIEESLKALEPE